MGRRISYKVSSSGISGRRRGVSLRRRPQHILPGTVDLTLLFWDFYTFYILGLLDSTTRRSWPCRSKIVQASSKRHTQGRIALNDKSHWEVSFFLYFLLFFFFFSFSFLFFRNPPRVKICPGPGRRRVNCSPCDLPWPWGWGWGSAARRRSEE